jgi:hypothetical protein
MIFIIIYGGSACSNDLINPSSYPIASSSPLAASSTYF